MNKLSRDYLDNEAIFYGCSIKEKRFCEQAYKAFAKNGIKLYPVGNLKDESFSFKVYKDLDELPKIPSFAHIVSGKDETRKIIKRLHELGIKKILFNSKNCVDEDTLKDCEKMGMQTLVACPMMILGSGPCRLHAFFAGVKR